MHFENYALKRKLKSSLILGPSFFFSKCVDIVDINALKKKAQGLDEIIDTFIYIK